MPSTTVAGKPAGIVMDWFRWHQLQPSVLIILGACTTIFILSLALLGITGGLSIFGLLIAIPFAIMTIKEMHKLADFFLTYHLVPGIVVATEPLTVAAYSDLSRSYNLNYPTVRILAQRLEVLKGSTIKQGDRIPMVASYIGRSPAPKWDSFLPTAATFATGDCEELAMLEARIPDEDWLRLNEALFQVPQPYCNGLFSIVFESPTDHEPVRAS